MWMVRFLASYVCANHGGETRYIGRMIEDIAPYRPADKLLLEKCVKFACFVIFGIFVLEIMLVATLSNFLGIRTPGSHNMAIF